MQRAALFDLDGTLIPNASAERSFFFHLIYSGALGPVQLMQLLHPLVHFRFNFHDMLRGNKHYLRHQSVEAFEEVARRYFEPRVERMVFWGMRQIVEQHRSRGDMLLLLSGTLEVIAECFVRCLKLDGAVATRLQSRAGRYTGRTEGVVPYGFGKLEVIRHLHHRYGLDQNSTTLYANLFSDRYVMNAVQEPIAVNPDPRLRDYAQSNGWKILNFKAP